MHHIVLGAGPVAAALIHQLRARGDAVRVLAPERAGEFPARADTLALLELDTPLALPASLVALAEARRVGVRRVVHLSAQDAERGAHVPSLAGKLAVERALRASGLPYTILRANDTFQSDLAVGDAIVRRGVYPRPLGDVGLSRVDARDVADAAVRALVERDHAGRSYVLAGPDALTGPQVATIYAAALGRPVSYDDGVDDFSDDVAGYDARLTYELYRAKGLAAGETQLAQTREILGRDPRDFGTWALEAAAAWEPDASGRGAASLLRRPRR